MKKFTVTVDTTKKNFRDEALALSGLTWKDVQFFSIEGNNVSIFVEEPENPVVCEFCGVHTTEGEYTHHILRSHPEEQ